MGRPLRCLGQNTTGSALGRVQRGLKLGVACPLRYGNRQRRHVHGSCREAGDQQVFWGDRSGCSRWAQLMGVGAPRGPYALFREPQVCSGRCVLLQTRNIFLGSKGFVFFFSQCVFGVLGAKLKVRAGRRDPASGQRGENWSGSRTTSEPALVAETQSRGQAGPTCRRRGCRREFNFLPSLDVPG